MYSAILNSWDFKAKLKVYGIYRNMFEQTDEEKEKKDVDDWWYL